MEMTQFGDLRALRAGTGSQVPLIVVHGMFGAPGNWLSYGRAWAQERPVSLLELPCHGSGGTAPDLAYRKLAQTVAESIQAVYPDQACLVLGHSLGGKVAMTLALEFPSLLEGVIVVDIAPRPYPAKHDDVFSALEAVNLGSLQSRTEADRAMAPWIADQFTRAFFLKSLIEENGRWRWNFDPEEIKRAYPAILSWDYGPGHGIVKPYAGNALFVRGSRSDYVSSDDNTLIHSLFTKGTIRTVEGAGHWVQADNRSGFLQALEGYL